MNKHLHVLSSLGSWDLLSSDWRNEELIIISAAFLSCSSLWIILLDGHILRSCCDWWNRCSHRRSSLDLSPDGLGRLLRLVVIVLTAAFFHVLHLGVCPSLLITVAVITVWHWLRRRPLLLLPPLDQDASTHLTRVGWGWEVPDLPGLVIHSLDHDKVVPVNLRIGNPLSLQGLLLLSPGCLLVLQPGHPVGDLLQDMSSVVRLKVQLVLQVLGRDQHLGVLLQQLGKVLEQAVLRSEKVKLEVPLLPERQH